MIHRLEVQVLILLLIASLVGIAARRLRLPYTLALVVAGLGLSFVHLEALSDLRLTPDLLLLLFLPPLLFEAAYHLRLADLRRNLAHIASLGIVGVVISVLLTACLTYAGIRLTGLNPGLGWTHAFLFAAVIAATDPISVLSLFKEMGAPKRLYQVVEGESLVNDGVAVVVFAIIAAVVGLPGPHGGEVAIEGSRAIASFAFVTFVKTAGGGILVGAGTGALVSVLTRQIDDHLIEITLTTLVAWGSFLVAEQLHVSGVLSTVAAGIVLGSFGSHYGMSPSTRMAVQDFWQYMGFLSNSFIFLLIGLELESTMLLAGLGAVAVGFVAVVLARALLIYLGLPLIDRLTTPLPRVWRHVLVWGGLRGSLSMVLILGLPSDFPLRHYLVNLVFGVVAVSLFLQGLTMAPLMRRLGILRTSEIAMGRDYEIQRATAIAARQVVLAAGKLFEEGLLDKPSHRELARWYETRHAVAQQHAHALAGETAHPESLLEGVKTLATIEREAIRQVVHSGVIGEAVGAELMAQLDARLDALDRAAHESEEQLLKTFATIMELPEAVPPAAEQDEEDSDD